MADLDPGLDGGSIPGSRVLWGVASHVDTLVLLWKDTESVGSGDDAEFGKTRNVDCVQALSWALCPT